MHTLQLVAYNTESFERHDSISDRGNQKVHTGKRVYGNIRFLFTIQIATHTVLFSREIYVNSLAYIKYFTVM